uniref:Uncharacterized protein n=1 Tax=Pyrodinium bahamense TaxID=73915 RepID=A0A7S0B5W0_9DINO
MEDADRLFALSSQVESIKHFLSHSWHDSGIEKWITLCWHFNLLGALLVSSLVVAIVKVPVLMGALPEVPLHDVCGKEELRYAPWCYIAGSLSFLFCLHVWHHMPKWLLGSRAVTVFFDKLCVHQADAERKEAGILAFAAFIANSEHVLCLWSPAYFTRLWCTLEMAATVVTSNKNSALRLVFLPLKLYKFAYSMVVVLLLVRVIYAINNVTGRRIPASALIGTFALVGPQVLTFATRQYFSDRMDLERQLRTFSVEGAACVSEADRAVVHQALRSWFGDLSTFNELVRTQVRAHIVAAIGSEAHVPIALNVPLMMLQVFYNMDYTMTGCYSLGDPAFNGKSVLEDLAWMFCMGSCLPVQLRIVSYLHGLPGWAVTIGLGLVVGGIFTGAFLVIFDVMGGPGPAWPMAIITAFCGFFFLLL